MSKEEMNKIVNRLHSANNCNCEGFRSISFESKMKRPQVSELRRKLLDQTDVILSKAENIKAKRELNKSQQIKDKSFQKVIKRNGEILFDIFKKTDDQIRPKSSQNHCRNRSFPKANSIFRNSLEQQQLRQYVEKPYVDTMEYKGISDDKVLLNKIESSIQNNLDYTLLRYQETKRDLVEEKIRMRKQRNNLPVDCAIKGC